MANVEEVFVAHHFAESSSEGVLAGLLGLPLELYLPVLSGHPLPVLLRGGTPAPEGRVVEDHAPLVLVRLLDQLLNLSQTSSKIYRSMMPSAPILSTGIPAETPRKSNSLRSTWPSSSDPR